MKPVRHVLCVRMSYIVDYKRLATVLTVKLIQYSFLQTPDLGDPNNLSPRLGRKKYCVINPF